MKIRHCAREACINMREEELESICGKYALAKGIAIVCYVGADESATSGITEAVKTQFVKRTNKARRTTVSFGT
ncbi:hypothetical protein T11_14094 [Trichinella zimbabwensis]|uniref:Uncharacterized protein n=1 Tax=Trichinella zimbabwensis TaxID=268475 RepID=A0A0V1GL30_9BILA|nr:hypothetical protein T11_14094 [Trichinella zimbabwensis]